MKYQRSKIYTDFEDYFRLDGDCSMILNRNAAKKLCVQAIKRNLIVLRFEGGYWHNPGFELRRDCIWDSKYNVRTLDEIMKSNIIASEFIDEAYSEGNDAFLLLTQDITKYQESNII